jgi:hypothetical protein
LSSSVVNSPSTGRIPGHASLLAQALNANGSYALEEKMETPRAREPQVRC